MYNNICIIKKIVNFFAIKLWETMGNDGANLAPARRNKTRRIVSRERKPADSIIFSILRAQVQ